MSASKIEKVYSYKDLDDELVFQVVRLEGKRFVQRRPAEPGDEDRYSENGVGPRFERDSKGKEWVYENQAHRIPYRWSEVAQAIEDGDDIHLTEGEKDADRLRKEEQLVATTMPEGAGAWKEVYADFFVGASKVIVWTDQDAAGRKRAREAAVSLDDRGVPVDVRSPQKGKVDGHAIKDVSDHLDAGYDLDDYVPGTGGRVLASDLLFMSIPEVEDEVEARGKRGYIAAPMITEEDYGAIGAADKAGKTWAACDLAVSVATGTPWMGVHECTAPGPVLIFYAEGGMSRFLRKLQAIAEDRDVDFEGIRKLVRVAFRAPRLKDENVLKSIRFELLTFPAKLIIVDADYLAKAGANASQLNEMGAMYGAVQELAEKAKAALVMVEQWNQGGSGSGPERFTGVGASAWGRFLGSASVEDSKTGADHETEVTLRWLWKGEMPDLAYVIERKVRSVDPDDPDSEYEYHVTGKEVPVYGPDTTVSGGVRQVVKAVVAMYADDGLGHFPGEIQSWIANDEGDANRRSIKYETESVRKFLRQAKKAGLLYSEKANGHRDRRWFPFDAGSDDDDDD